MKRAHLIFQRVNQEMQSLGLDVKVDGGRQAVFLRTS
jgi:hypothetical protein